MKQNKFFSLEELKKRQVCGILKYKGNGNYWQILQGENEYFQDIHEKSFSALYAYELNCKMKYDRPFSKPSLPIPANEQKGAYAQLYDVTIEQMDIHSPEMEKYFPSFNK